MVKPYAACRRFERQAVFVNGRTFLGCNFVECWIVATIEDGQPPAFHFDGCAFVGCLFVGNGWSLDLLAKISATIEGGGGVIDGKYGAGEP